MLHWGVHRVQLTKRLVALTFDIGWGSRIPPAVVDVLRKHQLHDLTFFLTSSWVAARPDLASLLVSEGYEIGSHGLLHVDYPDYDDEWIARQVHQSEQTITALCNRRPQLFRPPNGTYDRRVLHRLDELGYKLIHWSVDSIDWMNPGVEVIVHRAVSRIEPGSVILMHACDTCEQTVEALPRVINGIRNKGYAIVSVSSLLRQAAAETSR